MYSAGIATEASPSGFAAQLMDMFSQVIGEWARPLIAIAALAVMASTTLASLDVCPRISLSIIENLLPSFKFNRKLFYILLLITQVIGSTLILVLFMKSFKTFIDFATSVAFVSAPILAWFNHRAVYSKEIPEELQPGNVMRIWSLLGIFVMLAVASYYVLIKLS